LNFFIIKRDRKRQQSNASRGCAFQLASVALYLSGFAVFAPEKSSPIFSKQR
jgi:hypothetical protein